MLIAVAFLANVGEVCNGLAKQPADWLIGEKLVQASTTPTFSIVWMEAELRQQLQIASRNSGIAVLVDRRIDPNLRISLALDDVSFEHFLWNIADQADAGVVRLDNLYYLAPPDTIATIQQQLLKLELETKRLKRDSDIRKGLLSEALIRNGVPFEPRSLIENICGDMQIPVQDLTAVPHDLWPAIDLPYQEIWQAITLLLAGFDLELSVTDESGPRIVPVTKPETAEYRVPREVLSRIPLSRIAEMDGITVARGAGGDRITGKPAAVFAAMREMGLNSPQRKVVRKPGSREVLNLHVKASRGEIAASVAQLLGVRLAYSSQDRESLDETIAVDLDQVTAEELLDACLKGSGLVWSITETELQISKAKN